MSRWFFPSKTVEHSGSKKRYHFPTHCICCQSSENSVCKYQLTSSVDTWWFAISFTEFKQKFNDHSILICHFFYLYLVYTMPPSQHWDLGELHSWHTACCKNLQKIHGKIHHIPLPSISISLPQVWCVSISLPLVWSRPFTPPVTVGVRGYLHTPAFKQHKRG